MNLKSSVLRRERKRASVVCVVEGHLLVVRLKDPTSQQVNLFPPGGQIELGEAPVDAAVRETYEETGFMVTPVPHSELVCCYPFHWDATTYNCTTHFYRAVLSGPLRPPQPVNDASYLLGAEWLSLQKIPEAMAYSDEICQAVMALVEI